MRRCRLLLCLLPLALLAAPAARAMESAPVQSPRATATLVTDSDTISPGQALHVALRLRLAPGWHTYWQNPGDAGQAPSLDLTLPPGVTAGSIAWPAPQVQREGDLVTYGYQGDVLLPVRILRPAQGTTPATGAAAGVPGAAPLAITAQASWLVCERICVPESGRFRITLPPGPGAPAAEAALFAAAAAATPHPQGGAELAPDGTLTLREAAVSPRRLRSAVFIPDQPGRIDSAAPQPFTASDAPASDAPADALSLPDARARAATAPEATAREADMPGAAAPDAIAREATAADATHHEATDHAGTAHPSPTRDGTADPDIGGAGIGGAGIGGAGIGGAGVGGAGIGGAGIGGAGIGGAGTADANTADTGVVRLRLHLLPGQAAAPLPGVLLLGDADGRTRALALTALPVEAPPPRAMPLAEALGGALLAGLLLNLMPCVFPVLAMKALAVVRLSGAARGRVRAHALSYTAGVLAAFAMLAGVMLGLRAAGAAAGWGFQFQSPAFVAGMAWLMFAVGLSLSGALSFGTGLAGAGQSLAGRGGHAGSFFTGLLAVVVATPCTAPFMGAALAAALAADAPVTFAVFLAMGLGLAAPYLLLAALPRLGVVLPRPGRWMEVLKQALAFPMYGATAWLVWVLSEEAGPPAVLAAAAGLVLLGFAAWAHGLSQLAHDASGRPAGRRVAQAAAVAACLAALAVLPGIAALPPPAAAAAGAASPQSAAGREGVGREAVGRGVAESMAEPFSAARLAALRAAGRPVFVNMTAAWCITCLVNERIALAPPAVARAFASRGVAYLRGDWTRQDPEITAFLRAHARDGVPLYVFYPAGGGPGEVLPQLLTEHAVLARVAAGGA